MIIRCLLLFCLWQASYAAEIIDRIVAIVDDDIILLSELKEEIKSIERRAEQAGIDLPRDELVKQSLERLILIKLQLAEAKKLGLEIDDELVFQAMQRIAQQNGLSLEAMEQALLEEKGMDLAEYQQQLKQEILIQRLRQKEVINRIQISSAEIDHYLAQNEQALGERRFHLRHILIAVPEEASEQERQNAERLAQELVQRIRQGENFAELAMQYSDGAQALDGGDLGWLEANQVPTLFTRVLPQMQKGAVSDPIEAGNGYHIIQMVDAEGDEQRLVPQTHARHILIRTNELVSDQEAQQRLQKIVQRLQQGENFADLARAYSEDKASGIKGGDLGWVNAGDLVPEFEQVMDSLDIGEISEPFRSPFGWHIVQVLERRSRDMTLESKRAEAKRALQEQKSEEALRLYLRKLRDQAFVQIKQEALETLL